MLHASLKNGSSQFVFVLVAKGPMVNFAGTGTLLSSKAFRSRERALDYIGTFRTRLQIGQINDLQESLAQISVIALEVEEEEAS